MKKRVLALLAIIFPVLTTVIAQENPNTSTDSAALRALLVGRALPQERVYLHFDNTTYYLGETMWFKAFVTSHSDDNPTVLSRVLYVELMSPEGYVVKTDKYRIDDNGTCHGGIYLDPEYLSGFFEVRAYTRYMLNWGDESIFSRVFPVYDKVNNGDWEFRNIRDRSQGFFANKTFKKKIEPEIRFYPESGHLVDGIETRVAYELTGFNGIDLYEEITIFADGKPLLKTRPQHMGKGSFTLTPAQGTEYTARFATDNGKGKKKEKKYRLDLPRIESAGCVISVNEHEDSVVLVVESKALGNEEIGFAILHRNGLGFYRKIEDKGDRISLPMKELREGVNRAIVFCGRQPLAERLFFVQHDSLQAGDHQTVKLRVTGNGQSMHELEPEAHGRISLTVEREDGKPLDNETEFALSVSDHSGHQITSWRYNMYTYLLLGSELKGYIPDAHQYFDPENPKRKEYLDLVMLTNGWTAYDWAELTAGNFSSIVPPEEGIVVKGKLVMRVRNLKFGELGGFKFHPQPYMPVRIDFTSNDSTIKAQAFRTDSVGKFSIVLDDFTGKQTVALSPETYIRHSNKVNYGFYMDKYFSPKPKRFHFWQQNVGSSIRSVEDTVGIGMSKIGIHAYMFNDFDVTAKKRRRHTDTAPISELRLDYLEEWEYAMDVWLEQNNSYDLETTHDYSVPDASSDVEKNQENVNDSSDGVLATSQYINPVWAGFDNKQHNVLSVSDVLNSIYDRYDLGWQNWVYPAVIHDEYCSDSIPVYDVKYIHGIDVEAMTNFKEVILTSDPKKLETVSGGYARWKFREENVLPNKHPYERFYYGFLTQLGTGNKFKEDSRLYDSDLEYDMELASRNITKNERWSMEHPNNIAYLIPDRRDNKSLIRNDLSVSSSTRRYTSVQGYTVAKQFYSPDYSTMVPDGNDYRRTLLWNPSVKSVDGKLQVELYNSSTCNTVAVDVLGYDGNTVFSNDEAVVTREDSCIKRSNRVRAERVDNLVQDSIFLAQCEYEFGIAEMYYNKKNYKKALTAYIELLQYNYPPAFYRIGEYYMKGINLKTRYDLAASFLERGAELGVPGCYYELSQMHRQGLYYQQDREKEVELLEIAADLHEPRALLLFGQYLLNGEVVEKDTLRATGLLRECALTDNPEAIYEYSILMIAAGVEKDSVLGIPLQCVETAANGGSKDALMWMVEYEESNGNLVQAYRYALMAHHLGDKRGTKALADCYYHGRGVKRDKRLAKDLYRDAAKAGNEEAKRMLEEW